LVKKKAGMDTRIAPPAGLTSGDARARALELLESLDMARRAHSREDRRIVFLRKGFVSHFRAPFFQPVQQKLTRIPFGNYLLP
jgi:hypothetical protein